MSYAARIVDAELQQLLRVAGAVLIEGPRACGKTATARQHAASEVLLDTDNEAQALIAVDPGRLLAGATPRLIDEWQVAPGIWNHVRRAIDDRQAQGLFVLTGSSVPADEATRHTGAGRIARMRMRPMSLHELGHATGEVRLAHLFDGEPAHAHVENVSIEHIAECIAVGGWPGLQGDVRDVMVAHENYIDDVCRIDIGRATGVMRDPARIARLVRAYARSVSTLVATRTLALDAGAGGDALDRGVVGEYIDALSRVMVVEEQPAWAPHLRARSRVRGAAKRQFVDPSLAAAALGANPERMVRDLRFMGFLFESLVVRDLRVYAQSLRGKVLHYRDNTGLEVDAVVELSDGRWAAFEVKLGYGQVDEAASSLLRFADRVDVTRSGKPSSLNVVTAIGGYAYQRPDGVNVIPITALGP